MTGDTLQKCRSEISENINSRTGFKYPAMERNSLDPSSDKDSS